MERFKRKHIELKARELIEAKATGKLGENGELNYKKLILGSEFESDNESTGTTWDFEAIQKGLNDQFNVMDNL